MEEVQFFQWYLVVFLQGPNGERGMQGAQGFTGPTVSGTCHCITHVTWLILHEDCSVLFVRLSKQRKGTRWISLVKWTMTFWSRVVSLLLPPERTGEKCPSPPWRHLVRQNVLSLVTRTISKATNNLRNRLQFNLCNLRSLLDFSLRDRLLLQIEATWRESVMFLKS